MEAAKRLEKLIIDLNITPYRLAKTLGYERSDTIYNVLNGKYNISKNLAFKIVSQYPQVDLIWLLNGEGKMYKPGNTQISNKQSGSNNYNQQVNKGVATANEGGSPYERMESLEKEVTYLKSIIESKDKEIELLRRLLNGSPGNEQM